MTNKTKVRVVRIALSFALILTLLAAQVLSNPVGTRISYISNDTMANVGDGTARSGDKGGYITTINLNATQRNDAWKAYVGNLTGIMALQNSLNQSIYEWPVSLSQEVYISRNSTVNWGSVNCSSRTNITSEDSYLGLNSTSSKSINKTFNATVHKAFDLGGKPIATCPAISTYVSGTAQNGGVPSDTNLFQEVLLADNNANLIYAAIVDQDQTGFDGNKYDFQAIVGEDERLSTPTTYYFYVELG